MVTKCNHYPWEVKIKCNLNNQNVVLKLALAPLKFDIMKKILNQRKPERFTSLIKDDNYIALKRLPWLGLS